MSNITSAAKVRALKCNMFAQMSDLDSVLDYFTNDKEKAIAALAIGLANNVILEEVAQLIEAPEK